MRIPAGFDIANGKVILTNYKEQKGFLQPYECRVYLWET